MTGIKNKLKEKILHAVFFQDNNGKWLYKSGIYMVDISRDISCERSTESVGSGGGFMTSYFGCCPRAAGLLMLEKEC